MITTIFCESKIKFFFWYQWKILKSTFATLKFYMPVGVSGTDHSNRKKKNYNGFIPVKTLIVACKYLQVNHAVFQ